MFPEYRELISRLKNEDAHFSVLFQRHNELDHEVVRARIDADHDFAPCVRIVADHDFASLPITISPPMSG